MAEEEADLLTAHVAQYVNSICKHETEKLNENSDNGKRFEVDNRFIYCLSELVTRYSVSFAEDLGSFCEHAQRKTVNIEDIRLCCRKSEDMEEQLRKFMEENSIHYKNSKPNSKTKTKRTSKEKGQAQTKGKSKFELSSESSSDSDSDIDVEMPSAFSISD
mmetsp:Transcript_4196/g.4909  ORF Transcript_4196/g.4909 Transcript_4196/m.4909 type:complete len:161 (+) Transcript_4196:223-705(+)